MEYNYHIKSTSKRLAWKSIHVCPFTYAEHKVTGKAYNQKKINMNLTLVASFLYFLSLVGLSVNSKGWVVGDIFRSSS